MTLDFDPVELVEAAIERGWIKRPVPESDAYAEMRRMQRRPKALRGKEKYRAYVRHPELRGLSGAAYKAALARLKKRKVAA